MNTSQVTPAIAFRGGAPECRQCLTEIPIGSPSFSGGGRGLTPGLIQYHAECFTRAVAETRAQGTGGVQASSDIGDAVADELDRQLGRAAAPSSSQPPGDHRVPIHGRDIGDEVADELERQMFGTVRGVRS